MSWGKAFNLIGWKNYPSDETPIDENNLKKMENGINTVDDRVLLLDITKLDKAVGQTMVKDVSYNKTTGIFTVTYLNGATTVIDTKLEKLAVNFSYDAVKQCLVITLDDGTEQRVDLSTLITEYEFRDTATIAFETVEGRIQAKIKLGSVTSDMLESNYLADIQLAAGTARGAAQEAAASASAAKNSEAKAKTSEENASASAKATALSEQNAKASENASILSMTAAEKAKTEAESAKETATAKSSEALSAAQTATQKASAAAVSQTAAQQSAALAKQNAQTATDKSVMAKSYSEGGTGTRAGEDTDNAKYYMEQAKKQTDGMPTKVSDLQNDSGFISLAETEKVFPKKNGAADEMTVAFTEPAALAELTGGDTLKGLFGKLKKAVSRLISLDKQMGNYTIQKMTQAEYDALSVKNADTIYFITE